MDKIYSVDQIAPWRNDPAAVAAHQAMREWHVLDRKEQQVVSANKSTVKAKQVVIVAYGAALIEGKKQHKSNKAFKDWIEASELNEPPFNDPKERSNAIRISILGSSLRLDDCPFCWPSDIMKWARKTGLVQPKKKNIGATMAARSHVRQNVAEGKPINREEVTRDTGAADGTVGLAVAMEQARLEGVAEGEALALNAQGKFTKAQARHVEALTKKLQRDFNSQFAAAVEAQVNKLVEERKAALERAQAVCRKQLNDAFKDQQHWRKLIDNHKPIFTKAEYIDILFCARNDHVAQDKHHRATLALEAKKLQLTGEK